MFQKTLNRVFRCIPLLKYHINVDKALKIVPNRFYSRENYFKNANKIILYANVPPFLAFFRKKEEEGEKEAGMSFLEKILPDDIYLLIRKLPKQDESTPEGKLVTTMKRTILCIQRGQYEKAEQMGHLALRMAQDMQHYDGITLVYDVLANLAHETGQHKKAESLYVSVLHRLLMKNVPPDDIRILHLSLKVAQAVEYQGKSDEARTNYIWTMNKIEECRKNQPEDEDLYELWGLANNFYGKFLLNHGKYSEAKNRLKTSHDVYIRFRGSEDPDYINILNDLAVACSHDGDLESAEKYINEAIKLVSAYPEMNESGIYHANKGLILLKKGLMQQAEKLCIFAGERSKKSGNTEGQAQAKYCLEEVQKTLNEKKDGETG